MSLVHVVLSSMTSNKLNEGASKMKKFLKLGASIAVLILSACGTDKVQNTIISDEVPEIVEVVLNIPETAVTGEELSFIAEVKQGGKIVTDANEVKFEVVNISSGEKEMIEASLNEENHYEIVYTFGANGTYDVTSHVTARDMHTMPTKKIFITSS